VHRLDKDTSGVLVVAKHDFAHNYLSLQFKERTVEKTYFAISRGEPERLEGRVDLPLGKSYTNAKKQMARFDGSGREAVTEYRVIKKFRGYAAIECHPLTGRTHQIRVHLASLRLPVACDRLYGREKKILLSDLTGGAREPAEAPVLARQALHAASLVIRHPITHEVLSFTAPLPADMRALLEALERYRL
ncbi:MAG: RluA family pseudouridine synthase, partial [Planctomycetes bacterium]|nr:RluA family pseudouridine synthase [Planctomycetota bacterium]